MDEDPTKLFVRQQMFQGSGASLLLNIIDVLARKVTSKHVHVYTSYWLECGQRFVGIIRQLICKCTKLPKQSGSRNAYFMMSDQQFYCLPEHSMAKLSLMLLLQNPRIRKFHVIWLRKTGSK